MERSVKIQQWWRRSAWLGAGWLVAGAVSAAPVTTTFGSANSFGQVDVDGNPVAMAEGADFDNFGLARVDELDLYGGASAFVDLPTDVLHFDKVLLNLAYGMPSGATTAKIRLLHAGWGLNGQAEIFFNNQSLGFLKDGDSRPDALGDGRESVHFDQFDVAIGLLTGNDEIRIEIAKREGVSNPLFVDLGALDYVALDIEVNDNGGGTAPEPASLALAALGLAAAGAARRRRAR